MYLHVTEDMRIRECPQYRKGFCRLGEHGLATTSADRELNSLPLAGPECPLKHVRRVVCPNYLIGFCPKGPECPLGQYVSLSVSLSLSQSDSALTSSLLPPFRLSPRPRLSNSPKFEPEPDPPSSSTRIPDVSGARFLPEATFRLHRKDWLAWAADPSGGGGGGGRGGGGGGGYGGDRPGFVKRDLRCVMMLARRWLVLARRSEADVPYTHSQIDCYRCGQKGHYANTCPNPNVVSSGAGPWPSLLACS